MNLIKGNEYMVEVNGKYVKARYASTGGNETTGFDNNMFVLNRAIRVDGVKKKYVFIKTEDLANRIQN